MRTLMSPSLFDRFGDHGEDIHPSPLTVVAMVAIGDDAGGNPISTEIKGRLIRFNREGLHFDRPRFSLLSMTVVFAVSRDDILKALQFDGISYIKINDGDKSLFSRSFQNTSEVSWDVDPGDTDRAPSITITSVRK
jgi:hypothetical protein